MTTLGILVKDCPKVLRIYWRFIRQARTDISEKEAQNILQRMQEGVDAPKPKVLFEPGEVVRVTDGPFNDLMV